MATAIVTGGASGIGLAAARNLLRDGWRVVVADLAPEALESARESLRDDADNVRFERLDVVDEDAVVHMADTCDRTFGPIRGLVNSAGIGRDVPFLETSVDLFRQVVDINLTGTFLVAREAARKMRAHGGGAIVNIASIAGLRGSLGRAAYGASKGAVVTLTQVMAVELAADRVRVNAIAPGPIDTPLAREMHSAETRAGWLRVVPQGRYADPEEVASVIAFLLDEKRASYITGQTLAVDGGFAAGGLISR